MNHAQQKLIEQQKLLAQQQSMFMQMQQQQQALFMQMQQSQVQNLSYGNNTGAATGIGAATGTGTAAGTGAATGPRGYYGPRSHHGPRDSRDYHGPRTVITKNPETGFRNSMKGQLDWAFDENGKTDIYALKNVLKYEAFKTGNQGQYGLEQIKHANQNDPEAVYIIVKINRDETDDEGFFKLNPDVNQEIMWKSTRDDKVKDIVNEASKDHFTHPCTEYLVLKTTRYENLKSGKHPWVYSYNILCVKL